MEKFPIEDVIEITEVLSAWGFIHDNRMIHLFDEIYAPDVKFDLKYIGSAAEPQDLDGYRTLLQALIDNGVRADHHTMSTIVRRDADGNARARSRYITHWDDGRVVNGEYLDILRRTPAGWRICLRKMARRIPLLEVGSPPPEYYDGWPLAR